MSPPRQAIGEGAKQKECQFGSGPADLQFESSESGSQLAWGSEGESRMVKA